MQSTSTVSKLGHHEEIHVVSHHLRTSVTEYRILFTLNNAFSIETYPKRKNFLLWRVFFQQFKSSETRNTSMRQHF